MARARTARTTGGARLVRSAAQVVTTPTGTVELVADLAAMRAGSVPVGVIARRAVPAGPVVNALYISDPSDTTTPANGITVIEGSDGARWKIQMQGRRISAEWGGCVGDATGAPLAYVGATGTDNADAIDALLALCAAMAGAGERPTLYFPKGSGAGYCTSRPVVVPHGVDVDMDVPLIYTGSDDVCVLQIGDATTYTSGGRFRVGVARSVLSSWTDTANVAVRFTRINTSDIEVFEASSSTVGVAFVGDSGGLSYNEIALGNIQDNRYGVYHDSASGGWSNENQGYGGRIWCQSSTHPTLDRYGVRLGGTELANGNVYRKTSFELAQSSLTNGAAQTWTAFRAANSGLSLDALYEAWIAAGGAMAYAVYAEHAVDNVFDQCRFESVGCKVFLGGTSYANVVRVAFDWNLGIEVRADGNYSMPAAERLRWRAFERASRTLYATGPLHKVLVPYEYDETYVHTDPGASAEDQEGAKYRYTARGVSFLASSGNVFGQSTLQGIYLDDHYARLAANLGVGAIVPVRSVRTLVLSKDVEASNPGRFTLIPYDADMVRMTDPAGVGATTYVKGSPFGTPVWTNDWGGAYRQGSDAAFDLFVRVHPDVAYLGVFLGGGDAECHARGFQVLTSDVHAGAIPFAGANEVDVPREIVVKEKPAWPGSRVGQIAWLDNTFTASIMRYGWIWNGSAWLDYPSHRWFEMSETGLGVFVGLRDSTNTRQALLRAYASAGVQAEFLLGRVQAKGFQVGASGVGANEDEAIALRSQVTDIRISGGKLQAKRHQERVVGGIHTVWGAEGAWVDVGDVGLTAAAHVDPATGTVADVINALIAAGLMEPAP